MKKIGSIACALVALTTVVDAQVRVVSLAPSLTELVFALGAGSNLVARSSACDFPPEARALPVAGDFGRPNVEFLQSVHPDCVLVTDLENPSLKSALQAMGLRTRALPCESWDQLLGAARGVSQELGIPERGEAWVVDMTERRAALQSRVDAFWTNRPRPRVYLEVWGDPLTTPGAASFLNDLIRLAGGVNIAADLRTEYAHVNPEWIVDQDPDVIVLAYMAGDSGRVAALHARPGWANLRALQKGSVCDGIPPDILLRPGPRMLQGAEQLAEWLMRSSASTTSPAGP